MNETVLGLVVRALEGRPLGEPVCDARLEAGLEAHRVGAWLHRHGYGAGAGLAATLRRSAVQAAALRAADDEVRFVVLQAFTRQGLDPLPLKGSVLGPLCYAAPYLRPAHDLDVLIRGAAARVVAAKTLTGLGFLPAAERFAPASHETAFVRGNDLPVEVHSHITQEGRYAARLDDLLARSIPWQWRGLSLRRLCDEDMLAHWVVHAAHHKFRLPLVQWLDVVLLLRAGVDLAAARARCAAWGAAGAWYTAGATLDAWFGIPDLLAGGKALAPWRAAYLRRLPRSEAPAFGPRPLAAWSLTERMTWRFAARYLAVGVVQKFRQLRSRSGWRSIRLGWSGKSSTSAGRKGSPQASQ